MKTMKDEKMKEVQKLTEELEKGIQKIFQSEQYKNYLEVVAKRPSYSIQNTLLIYFQCPKATYVAGYKKFLNDFGMQVQKGAKAIRIFAPILYKQKEDKKNKTEVTVLDMEIQQEQNDSETEDYMLLGFRVVKVFDISQTKPILVVDENGEEQISPKAKDFLEGLHFGTFSKLDVADTKTISNLRKSILEIIPIPIRQQNLNKELHGYFSYKTNHDLHIMLNSNMDIAHSILTLVHEWAHYILHNPYGKIWDIMQGMKKQDKELQAESIAYIVLKHFGIDTSAESFCYITLWSQDKTQDHLKRHLQIIQKTATDMILQIEAKNLILKNDSKKTYNMI